ncbi:hypothetical protein GCM10023175_54100 [Pseudonocardia xishanensis]|uniref:TnpV protein n=2 Tax=Pseudonocardiaceae TaxID=2070 RepID=A0ABP8RZE5_9PSEU
MNEYGAQAMTHWRRWLPSRYAQIASPETFFAELGLEVADQITDLSTELAGDDPARETYLEKVGRLNAARQRAREMVLAEQVLLPPEPEAAEVLAESSPVDPWTPLIEDSAPR